jgi:hypothetical protein
LSNHPCSSEECGICWPKDRTYDQASEQLHQTHNLEPLRKEGKKWNPTEIFRKVKKFLLSGTEKQLEEKLR